MTTPHPPADPFWIGETDAWLLAEGRHLRPWQKLGAHPTTMNGQAGVAFAVWAPAARQVELTGDFNHWQPQPMRLRPECGVWELFVPGAHVGHWYKFAVHGADGRTVMKADPYARQTELPPGNAACVCEPLRDIPLLLLTSFGGLVLYSAGGGAMQPFALSHFIRFGVFAVMAAIIASLPRDAVRVLTYPGYLVVLLMLLAVEIVGQVGGGSQRLDRLALDQRLHQHLVHRAHLDRQRAQLRGQQKGGGIGKGVKHCQSLAGQKIGELCPTRFGQAAFEIGLLQLGQT